MSTHAVNARGAAALYSKSCSPELASSAAVVEEGEEEGEGESGCSRPHTPPAAIRSPRESGLTPSFSVSTPLTNLKALMAPVPKKTSLTIHHSRGSLSLELSPFTSVGKIKEAIAASDKIRAPGELQKLYFRGRELADSEVLSDCGIWHKATLILALAPDHGSVPDIQVFPSFPAVQEMVELAGDVRVGMLKGFVPKLAEEGLGGTYFLK